LVVEQKIDFARHLAQKFFIMEKGSLLLMEDFNLTDSLVHHIWLFKPRWRFFGMELKGSGAQPCIEISRIWLVDGWALFFRVPRMSQVSSIRLA